MADNPTTSNTHGKVIPISDELARHLAQEASAANTTPSPESQPLPFDPNLPSTQSSSPSTPLAQPTAFGNLQPSSFNASTSQAESAGPLSAPSDPPPAPPPPDHTPPSGLTPEQAKYIHAAAWGPALSWIYYLGNKAWLYAAICFLGPGVASVVMQLLLGSLAKGLAGDSTNPAYAALFLSGLFWYLVASIAISLGLLFFNIFQGRRVAWKARQPESFEVFQRSQRRWDLWAKIIVIFSLVAIPLLGLAATFALIAINPTSRIDEANNSAAKTALSQVTAAVERCYVASSGNYDPCQSIDLLVAGQFLKTADTKVSQVKISLAPSKTEAIIFVPLAASGFTCDQGSGPQAYQVYITSSATKKIICGTTEPSTEQLLDSSTTPTVTQPASLPTISPTKQSGQTTNSPSGQTVVSDVTKIAAGMESCYTQSQPNNYSQCRDFSTLVKAGYVKPPIYTSMVYTSRNEYSDMMVYASLTEASCITATNPHGFYVYRTTTGEFTTECNAGAPRLEQ